MFAATNQKSISAENEQAKRTMKHRGSVGRGVELNEDDCKHDAQKETLKKHACKRTCGEGKEGDGRDWRLTVLPPLTTNLFEGLITDDGFL